MAIGQISGTPTFNVADVCIPIWNNQEWWHDDILYCEFLDEPWGIGVYDPNDTGYERAISGTSALASSAECRVRQRLPDWEAQRRPR